MHIFCIYRHCPLTSSRLALAICGKWENKNKKLEWLTKNENDHLQWIVLYMKYDPSPSKKWERWQNCHPQNHTLFCSRNGAKSSSKSWETALHSTKREQWLPLAAWLALSGFGFQFLSLISAFFYFSGQSSFSFCEHLFFYSKEKCFRVSIAAVLASKHKGTN